MIELDADWLFFVYLALFGTPILLVWYLSESGRTASQKQALRGLTSCRICSTVYPWKPDSSEPTTCPECGTRNEPRPVKIY